MNATFFCENTLCALNENKECLEERNPLKCNCRNNFMDYCEELCSGCEEITKCDTCEFNPDAKE